MGSFSSLWVRKQLPSLATFKKAFRARTNLIRDKQSGKFPEDAGASSAHDYTMQAISLPFDSSRNLFLHLIWSYTGFRGTKFSSYTLDSLAIYYFGCNRLTPPVQPLLLAAASKEEVTGPVRFCFLYCSRTFGARGRSACCLALWLCPLWETFLP